MKKIHLSFLSTIQLIKSITLLVLFFLVFSYQSAHSQVFWTENFTNNCPTNCLATGFTGTNGAWTVLNTGTNGLDNNNWYVSAAEEGFSAGNCAAQNGTDDCLHISSNFNTFGDQGADYVNDGLGGTFDILTDSRAESPTINCGSQTNISISFDYIEGGEGTNDNAILWYFDGTTWSQLIDLTKSALCFTEIGTWATYTQALPASANNNTNVKIGFSWVNNDNALGDAPSFAVDDIVLSATTSSNDSINTQAIAAGPFCGCDALSVPFVSSGTFNAGNVYTLELSDASGSFASPTSIGTLTSTANNGTVNATIPCGTATGAGYRVRVVSSSPAITGFDNGTDFTINTNVTPTVSITATITGSFCANTGSFTASGTNGGSTPSYQWMLNGSTVGTDSVGYITTGLLSSGDIVSVILTSNAQCAIPTTIQANNTISCLIIDSITTGAIAAGPFCGCDSIDVPFTSSGTYVAGNVYTVELSDASGSFATPTVIGSLSSTSNAGTIDAALPCNIASGAGYLVRVVSSSPAVIGSSNGISFTATTFTTPTATISATFNGSICTDSTTTLFTANITNGGTTPSFQWQLNGVNVGSNSATFDPDSVMDFGDIVTVILTSNASCVSATVIQEDTVIICNTLTAGAIVGSPFCGCDSVDVPFTSTGILGAGNVYTAQLSDELGNFTNPVTIGTLASATNNGTISAAIPCNVIQGNTYLIQVLTSSPLDTSVAAASPLIINPIVVPMVSLSTTATTDLCIDTTVAFAATPTNGGTAPNYIWERNGIVVGSNSPLYTTSGAFMMGETITITMVSNEMCAVPDTVQDFMIIDCPQIEIPNVFTPNGDGINDLFRVNLSGRALEGFKIQIYDRWGILMFSSSSINYKWDGRTTSGQEVKDGTYFYVVELNGTVYKGYVMVLH